MPAGPIYWTFSQARPVTKAHLASASRVSIGGVSALACNLSLRLDRRWNMVAEHGCVKFRASDQGRGPLLYKAIGEFVLYRT
jgi:hypothetical protein